MGKPPLSKEEKPKDDVDTKKELKKQKQLKDRYLAQYKKEVLNKEKR